MKKLISFAFLLLLVADLSAQTDDYVAPDLFAKKGKTAISVYLGYNSYNLLYWFGAITPNDDYNNYGTSSEQFDCSAPIGITAEHYFTDRFSLGIEFSRFTTNYNFTKTVETYESSTYTYLYTNYNYKTSLTATKFFLRPTFHMDGYKKYDAYFFCGIGYRGFKQEVNTTDPNPTEPFYPRTDFPLGFKPGFGLRMMPHPNIGIQFEMALANPPISIGLVGAF